MSIRLHFLGAARSVTGSRYLLETSRARVLIDGGLHQEREFRARDFTPFLVPPKTLDAVVLTHAHLDHCGLLPKLAVDGLHCPLYATAPTAEMALAVMEDSGRIQEEDARFKNERHQKEGRAKEEVKPLYTAEDVQRLKDLWHVTALREPQMIAPGIKMTLQNAGHILGSASCRLEIEDGDQKRAIVFSGDLGGPGRPIIHDPDPFRSADYVVVESTYGDRLHEKADSVDERLCDLVNWTVHQGGNVIIPSFAIERAQELLYHLAHLFDARRIPPLMVFLDSPMAVKVTEVFRRYSDLYDDEMQKALRAGHSPFDFSELRFCSSKRDSQAINAIRGTAIIIAGSGMCTGGRIKHHLLRNLSRKESAVLFVGYQASGTLGREIVDGAEAVRILGQNAIPVRARVEQIQGFSGHADRDELYSWLKVQKRPRHLFVTHGGEHVSAGFAEWIHEQLGWSCSAPCFGDCVEL